MIPKNPQEIQPARDTRITDVRLQAGPGWEKLPMFWFLLFLSYKCTRRCRYCYTFNQVGSQNRAEMDRATFDRLLDWLPQVWAVNNCQLNAVNFLGGEPLLRTDRIRRMMAAIRSQTSDVQAMINTNADLVDTVDWDDLADIQWIFVNISDLSMNELDRRMKVIRSRSNTLGQTLTVTLDQANMERLSDIVHFAMEKGFRLRFNKDLFRGRDQAYQQRLLNRYHLLCDLLEDYLDRGYKVHTPFMVDLLVPGWDLPASPYPCGRRVAVVFPDGGIGPCIRDHQFKTGTIFDLDPLDRLNCRTFHFDLDQPDIPKACKRCSAARVCQGGCPHDKIKTTGTRAGASAACRVHKEIIPRLTRITLASARTETECTMT